MLSKIRNLFRKKDLRSIPLIHVHTFKTGEKLYTYSKEHYGTIASRYWYALNRALNYITMYGQDEHSVRMALDKIQKNIQDMTVGLNIQQNGFDANTSIEFLKSYVMNKTALQLKYQEILFTMFYLLEDEIEGGYSDSFNAKKLELINKDAKMRDVFFSSVQTIAKDLDIILETSTEEMIKQTVKLLELQQKEAEEELQKSQNIR